MLDLLWGIGASAAQPPEASVAAGRATAKADILEEHLKAVVDRLDKLTLVCMAVWSLLQERADVTDEELLERVKEIDLRDGVADGKVTPTVANCPNCNRVMSPRHKRCLYCGFKQLNISAFDQTL